MRKWCHRITTITDTSINIRIIVFQKYLTKENTLSKKVLPNQVVESQEKKKL